MILRRASQHGWAADIDIFDGFMQFHVGFRDGLLKGIQIHHDQIYRRDPVLLHHCFVCGIPANVEQSAMHPRMQRLNPAIKHLWKPGMLA